MTIDNSSKVAMFDLAGWEEGSVLINDGSKFIILAPGPAGYYLKTQGTGDVPMWSDPGTGSAWNIDGGMSNSTYGSAMAIDGGGST